MLQTKRVVIAPTLREVLRGAEARPKAWLIRRGTPPLILPAVPQMSPVRLTIRGSGMPARQATAIRRPSATMNEPHNPLSINSLSPRSSRCWRLERLASVWPGSLVV
jgi:hypothetical protein